MKSIGWLCFHETKDIKIISWKKCETIAYFICLNFSQPGADFSGGLRPEHAGALNSRGDRGGARSPSLPPTPMSPRSPLGTQSPFGSPRASPVPSHRSPSPRRFDVGFASAVANLCEQAHTIADQDRQKRYGLFFLYWCFFFFFFFWLYIQNKTSYVTTFCLFKLCILMYLYMRLKSIELIIR